MIVRIPPDPRLAPLIALRRLMPLPGHDKADQEERHILRREELRQAVKRDR